MPGLPLDQVVDHLFVLPGGVVQGGVVLGGEYQDTGYSLTW